MRSTRRTCVTDRAYKTTAFVLRGRNLGEADRIFTLFTRSRGKLDAVAKGVRRTKSHLAGRLEFLAEAELTFHAGRSLDVITSATLLHSEWEALVEPTRFAVGSLVAELIDAFCEPDLAQPEIYELLRRVVPALASARDARALLPRFELRLLDALGLAPVLDRCVVCDEAIGAEAWLDPGHGGLVCAAHRGGTPAAALGEADVANARALAAAPGGEAAATMIARPAVARAVDAFVTYHLGKRARSGGLLDELASR
ncbi:MAG: DNA repair protein RecO [Candidatus Eremiobacteraeota bacterium]|nr:DNA repair protein RecO [Candidatus Eremiobacteraeota bacterium]